MKPIFKDPVPGISRRWHKTTLRSHCEPSPRSAKTIDPRMQRSARAQSPARVPPLNPGETPRARPALRGSARCLLGLVVFPAPGWECLLRPGRRLGAEAARARVRSARAGCRGRLPGSCGCVWETPCLPGPWAVWARGRGPPVKARRGGVWGAAPAGVSRAGLPGSAAPTGSESWKAWGAGECGAAAARGPRPPRRLLRWSRPVGQAAATRARLRGARSLCAREVRGGGGPSSPAQPRSPHCFLDPALGGVRPRRVWGALLAVVAEELCGGSGLWHVAPRSVGPAVGGRWIPGGRRLSSEGDFGQATPTPRRRSVSFFGHGFLFFSCAFALGLAESEVTRPVSPRRHPVFALFFFFYPRTFVVQIDHRAEKKLKHCPGSRR